MEDELLSLAMPHDANAERAVLGAMLIDADCIKDVMDQLQPEDFYLQQNREIFETIYSMFLYSRPVDGVTVVGEMEKNGLCREDTRSYLLQMMEMTPTSANVMEYAGIIRDKALLRAVAKAAGDISAMVRQGVGGAEDLCHSPGPHSAGYGIGGRGAAGCDEPSGRTDRRGRGAAGAFHGPFRRGPDD